MRHTPLTAIIILTAIGAGAAAWWAISADERRVSECRDAGIQDQNRLARCARGTEARDAVLAETRGERTAELRRRVRVRLAKIQASRPAQADRHQYKQLSIKGLQESGLDPDKFSYEIAEVPATIAGQRIAINSVLLYADVQKYSFDLTGGLSKELDQT